MITRVDPATAYRGLFEVHTGAGGGVSAIGAVMVLLSERQSEWYYPAAAATLCAGAFVVGRVGVHHAADTRAAHRLGATLYLMLLYIHSGFSLMMHHRSEAAQLPRVSAVQLYFYACAVSVTLVLCGLVHGTQGMTGQQAMITAVPFLAKVGWLTHQEGPALLPYLGGSTVVPRAVLAILTAVALLFFCVGLWLARLWTEWVLASYRPAGEALPGAKRLVYSVRLSPLTSPLTPPLSPYLPPRLSPRPSPRLSAHYRSRSAHSSPRHSPRRSPRLSPKAAIDGSEPTPATTDVVIDVNDPPRSDAPPATREERPFPGSRARSCRGGALVPVVVWYLLILLAAGREAGWFSATYSLLAWGD